MNGWTPKEIEDLALACPELVRESSDGPVPLVTPNELHASMMRFPTMYVLPRQVDAGQPDATLRARFPSMFET